MTAVQAVIASRDGDQRGQLFLVYEDYKEPVYAPEQVEPGRYGSLFDGEGGVRVAFWSYPSDEMSEDGTNTCDEYVFVLEGSYILFVGGEPRPVLMAGDNFLIPKGIVTGRKVLAGTRVIHAFSGATPNLTL